MGSEPTSPSLKQKLRSTLCISGCFRQIHHHHHHHHHDPLPFSPGDRLSNLDLTPSPRDHQNHNRIKSPRLSRSLSKSQDKCRSLIQKIGGGPGGGGGRHIRRHTTDFRYDAVSYSLNFDKGDDENLNQFPFRNFSSRLPHSPPSSAKASTVTEAEKIPGAGIEIFAAS
ncbi:PREDICTED: uncharacterized protein LOC104808923 [Tarenaya hassleriana]|uniref:uncharacterized protein LOC104808923 n=1 Tax=Tarenaya hassleriana TaxID=28532 RepID=UPI00053CA7F7|nr:PREDICTED: uncharacterized protein LOC104808923 [Tarenaya hassleriana]